MNPYFLKLSCAVQTYVWGKEGEKSEVAKLKKGGDPTFAVDQEQTYAEVGVSDDVLAHYLYSTAIDMDGGVWYSISMNTV